MQQNPRFSSKWTGTWLFLVPLTLSLTWLAVACPAPNPNQNNNPSETNTNPDGGPQQVTDKSPFQPDPTLPPLPNVPCPPTLSSFQDKLWEPLLAKQCMTCHNAGGAAKDSKFVLRPPSESNALSKNLQITAAIALQMHQGSSVLLLRATGTHPDGHPGGAIVRLGSEAYNNLQEFISQLTGDIKECKTPSVCDPNVPGFRKIRRLTREEFDNTIQDLFGFPSTWGKAFVPDVVVNGFDNNADALTVTPLFADQLRRASEEIAEKALTDAQHIVPCALDKGDRNCASQFLDAFGKRMFRQPFEASHKDTYLKLYDLGAKTDFRTGIKMLLSAMLQSPYFLYRRELGQRNAQGIYVLSPFELASSLSYFFWGSSPDQTLLQAAESGKLSTPEQIAEQAKRLLESPKSQFLLTRFFVQWLGVERILTVPKDSKLFPSLTPDLRTAMLEEVKRFVHYTFTQGDGTLKALLTSNVSIINAQLAKFYGVPAPTEVDAAGYGKVTFPKDQRSGLLTMGAVLATHARPNDSSPIHRGLLVREKFLCQHLPPPPANINAEPPGLDPKLTTRERYTQHSTDPVCAGCHRMIDPIGFGFERFDGIGQYRTSQNGKEINDSGEIINANDLTGTFKGILDLSQKLASSTEVQQCVSLQWMRWAYGTKENEPLLCILQQVQSSFAQKEYQIKDLLIALTQTAHFRMRQAKDNPPNPNPPDGNNNSEPSPEKNTPDAGAPDASIPEPPTPEPPAPLNLKIEVQEQSKWESGYCNQVFITNQDTSEVVWKIQLDVQGTINQLWNATSSPATNGKIEFSGVAWNMSLKPMQTTNFGFCAKL